MPYVQRRLRRGLAAVWMLALGAYSPLAHAAPPMQRITHGLPPLVQQSRSLGPVPAQQTIALSLVLPLRNEAQLNALLTSLYTPGDPAYGHYLTTAQFTAQFGPTQADYDAVIAWAKSQGLAVTETYVSRKIVRVQGTAAVVGRAFGVQFQNYLAPDGSTFRAPTSEARVPVAIAARLAAVLGLDTTYHIRKHIVRRPANPFVPEPFPPDGGIAPQGGGIVPQDGVITPLGGGMGGIHIQPHGGTLTGPDGGLSPFGIQVAYDLADPTTGNSLTGQTGKGQTLGLYELDGYTLTDITAYENQFAINHIPLQNVLIDGYSGAAGSGADEVTLDIEMMAALAPGVNKIIVYEGNYDGSDASITDVYQRIADDNQANVVSTSWGGAEDQIASDITYIFDVENAIFMQMATQGQSFFAASGDGGSWDQTGSRSSLHADDPASQPYMAGVGGTSLTTNSSTGVYTSEKVWNNSLGAGGGGISILWPLPTWQQNIFDPGVTSNGSATMRNVPDVSLDADPLTGYAFHFQNSWGEIGGGTSAAAPLWAAFTALVNQARVANNCPVLGFANPPIYYLAKFNHPNNAATGPNYANDFHDITTGNNNVNNHPQFYPAVTGFDDATGWGTFNGAHLLGDLTSMANSGVIDQIIGDGGFEQSDANLAPWISSPNVIVHISGHPAHSGRWQAELCGYGATHTDTLVQTVRIPALASSATLSFWLQISTAETTATQQNDTMQVQVRDASGNVLATLATYSNLDHNTGWVQKSFTLTPIASYAGQTVQIYFTGTENASLRTSFYIDDVTLAITE
jgi:kumamolisin